MAPSKSAHALPIHPQNLHPNHASTATTRPGSAPAREPPPWTSDTSKLKATFERDSCLAPKQHGIDFLEDIQCHFFGCVPISERVRLMNSDDFWTEAAEIDRKEYPPIPWIKTQSGSDKDRREFIRYIAALGLQAERRRIEVIRKQMSRPGASSEQALVINVRGSLDDWRDSSEYKKGLKWIREWRLKRLAPTAASTSDPKQHTVKERPEEKLCSHAHRLDWCSCWPLKVKNNEGGTAGDALKQRTENASPAQASAVSKISEKERAKQQDEEFDKVLVKRVTEFLSAQKVELTGREETRKLTPYSLEKDVKVHILQFVGVPTEEVDNAVGRAEMEGLMQPYQVDDKSLHDGTYKGRFPDQVGAPQLLVRLLAPANGYTRS
jgi:hypothetical protein